MTTLLAILQHPAFQLLEVLIGVAMLCFIVIRLSSVTNRLSSIASVIDSRVFRLLKENERRDGRST